MTTNSGVGSDSKFCVLAYPGSSQSRVSPSQSSALGPLELQKNEDVYELFSTRVIQKFLNPNDPFRLVTHAAGAGTKVDEDRLVAAANCLWYSYYAPLTQTLNQSEIANRKRNASTAYVDLADIKKTIFKFKEDYLEGNLSLKVTNSQILNHCSSMLHPLDVFEPCKENCISNTNSLKQPHLMQEELRKYDKNIKRLLDHLMSELDSTRKDLKIELDKSNVAKKKVKQLLSEKFGSITYVPDEKIQGKDDETKSKTLQRRKKETIKKQRQVLQTRLLKAAVPERGRLNPKYASLFTLETPFELSNREGRYNRNKKRIDLQLRFKVDQALANTERRRDQLLEKESQGETTKSNRLKRLIEKADILKQLKDEPYIDRPLKLVAADATKAKKGQAYTVAKGGDRVPGGKRAREKIKLFGIREFKDKEDSLKQKYSFSPKTESMLGGDKRISYKIGVRIRDQEHPTVKDFRFFDKTSLDNMVQLIFLKFLGDKLQGLTKGEQFDVGNLIDYERISIPYISMYELIFEERKYVFSEVDAKNAPSSRAPSSRSEVFELKDVTNMPSTPPSLKYRLALGPNHPVEYNQAVQIARKIIRSNPQELDVSEKALFYLRNENTQRMNPLNRIIRVLELHNDN